MENNEAQDGLILDKQEWFFFIGTYNRVFTLIIGFEFLKKNIDT